MDVVRYSEAKLLNELKQLPKQFRVAFAALCAERALPAYVAFSQKSERGNAEMLVSIMERLWRDLEGEQMPDSELDEAIETCMHLIPTEEDGPWMDGQAYAEDAAAAVAYALRTRKSGDPQEAAWAARRTYEALDNFVMKSKGLDPYAPGGEERILADPIIQAELIRQQHNLSSLRLGLGTSNNWALLSELRARARLDALGFFGF